MVKKQERFIAIKHERSLSSATAFVEAHAIAQFLALIPSIKCIAISGSLAMANSTKDSDIDYFIITKQNSLWISRLFVIGILIMLGKKRIKKMKYPALTVCTNYWISECDLLIPQQNLYTAHEIAQMIPVVNKEYTYERFMQQNNWIISYLPNIKNIGNVQRASFVQIFFGKLVSFLLSPLNVIAFFIQYLYMKRDITFEEVNLHSAKFHPVDRYESVLKMYDEHFIKLKLGEEKARSTVRAHTGRFYSGIYAKSITPGS